METCSHRITSRILADIWKCSKCGELLKGNVTLIIDRADLVAKLYERGEIQGQLFLS